MILTVLKFERETYGENKGRLLGKAVFKSPDGEVHYDLSEPESQDILKICQAGLGAALKRKTEQMDLALTNALKRGIETKIGQSLPDHFA